MKIKGTMALLIWCRNELKLTPEQERKVMDYVAHLESIIWYREETLLSIARKLERFNPTEYDGPSKIPPMT